MCSKMCVPIFMSARAGGGCIPIPLGSRGPMCAMGGTGAGIALSECEEGADRECVDMYFHVQAHRRRKSTYNDAKNGEGRRERSKTARLPTGENEPRVGKEKGKCQEEGRHTRQALPSPSLTCARASWAAR